jgi:hypothetical protein
MWKKLRDVLCHKGKKKRREKKSISIDKVIKGIEEKRKIKMFI